MARLPAFIFPHPVFITNVTGIAKVSLPTVVQLHTRGHNVMNFGNGCIDVVNQPQRVVGTNTHPHAEVPFFSFFGLVNFRRSTYAVAILRLVLGGAG